LRLTSELWKLREASPDFGLDAGALATFKESGELLYTIPQPGRLSVVRLTYRVVGKQLITNRPSAPREEDTSFEIVGDQLHLTCDQSRAVFERCSR
jgi:hypothetical protein